MTAELIIYAIVAAGLVFWLRSVLGTRHGEERSHPNSLAKSSQEPAASPDSEFAAQSPQDAAQSQITDLAENPTAVLSIDNKSAENGLLDIAAQDKVFDIKFFLQAAQDVFAMVVETFAEGDREALDDLLGDKVYKAFDQAIAAREAEGNTQSTEIHAISQAKIIEAQMDGKTARVTIRFEADQTSTTYDKDEKLIAGHPDRTTKMVDIWTFSRDVKSKDPRWMVIETRGDFEDDNDLIPDTE